MVYALDDAAAKEMELFNAQVAVPAVGIVILFYINRDFDRISSFASKIRCNRPHPLIPCFFPESAIDLQIQISITLTINIPSFFPPLQDNINFT